MVDLKILLSDQQRAFWFSGTKFFPKFWICARIQQITKAFFIEQIQKKLITNFPVNSESSPFGPYFPFLGKKIFLRKSGSVTLNTTWTPNTMPSSRTKLRKIPKLRKLPDRRTEG